MLRIARRGGDPCSVEQKNSITFYEAAQKALEAQRAKWSSDKHGKLWWSSLERYVFPALAQRPLESIGAREIHAVLEPIWVAKYDTARKVKQRISVVFDWAKGSGHYHLENPVNGIKKALPAVRREVRHHPALDWQALPDFMLRLSRRDDLSARLLEVTILTCLRSGEVRGMRWEELDDDTWTVPAQRMKLRQEHRVPLSHQLRLLLDKTPRLDADFVFPSPNGTHYGKSRPMSDMVFSGLMKRMGVAGITTHGFRSTFKDWCTDNAVADWELSEMVLSHSVGNAVERAYARSDLLDRRRDLMQLWSDYALSKVKPMNRVRLKRRSATLQSGSKIRKR